MENKGFQLFAYVIMSNYIYLVADSSIGDLSSTIRDYKPVPAGESNLQYEDLHKELEMYHPFK